MHRVLTDILWLTVGVYIATVVLREFSLIVAPYFPSVTRGIEFGIGTGGHGAGTAA